MDEYPDKVLGPGELDDAAEEVLGEIGSHLDCFEEDTIYTGVLGVYFLRLWRLENSGVGEELRKRVGANNLEEISKIRGKWKKSRISFLNGSVGQLCLLAWSASICGMWEEVEKLGRRVFEKVLEVEDAEDELLYGRAGGLWCLLFLRKILFRAERIKGGEELDAGQIPSEVRRGEEWMHDRIARLAKELLRRGREMADGEKLSACWAWHGKIYFGAAHGMAGILSVLAQCPKMEDEDEEFLHRCFLELAEVEFPSGNAPSSAGSTKDRLVQWCHGAPGVGLAMLHGYARFRDGKLLEKAKRCGDVVWERGMLRRLSLCHGIAGNLIFLCRLGQVTEEEVWLKRARRFGSLLAQWRELEREGRVKFGDSKYSLFEGFAGVVIGLEAAARPESAKFPGMDL